MTAIGRDRERIGIFGGSFNPPHIAHLIVAELVREQFDLDGVLWVPNRRSPLKQEAELASAEDRVALTRAAVRGNDAFEVSEIELRREGVSYTIDTIDALQGERPGAEFFLVIGSDSLASLDRWHRAQDILDRVAILVFRRPGHASAQMPSGLDGRITFVDAPMLEISGTEIRRRIRSGQSIRYMVTESVREMLQATGLYR